MAQGVGDCCSVEPPFTLHPTPHTLHPTPYTLHPTPYTLHHTQDTLHHTPYTLHPTLYTIQPSPYTLHPTPYTLHLQWGAGRSGVGVIDRLSAFPRYCRRTAGRLMVWGYGLGLGSGVWGL
jgi:hypothetical protein